MSDVGVISLLITVTGQCIIITYVLHYVVHVMLNPFATDPVKALYFAILV